ncbi:MAG: hypothetical protein OEV66_11685 [Spirochaetia bacterium]|nr:hypothetical protein [Spirochaetia bacterium]
MENTLDIIIAYISVVAGLSIANQILVEFVKNMFGLRWQSYQYFLKILYKENFNAGVRKDNFKEKMNTMAGRFLKKNKIGSVLDRFQSFAKQVEQLWGDLNTLREIFAAVYDSLEKSSNSDDFLFSEEYNKLRKTLVRIEALEPMKLFRQFSLLSEQNNKENYEESETDVDGIVQDQKKGVPKNQSGVIQFKPSEVQKTVHAIRAFLKDPKKATPEEMKKTFQNLVEIEEQLNRFKIRLTNNIDNWLKDLEKHYTVSIAKWNFLIALIFVIGINADAVQMFKTMQSDPVVKKYTLEKAEQLVKNISIKFNPNALNEIIGTGNEIAKSRDDISPGLIHNFLDQRDKILAGVEKDNERIQSEALRSRIKAIREIPLQTCETGASDMNKTDCIKNLKKHVEETTENIHAMYLTFESQAMKDQLSILQSEDMILGWSRTKWNEFCTLYNNSAWAILSKIFGWLLTTVLISFGASFWNDLLKALLGIKGIVKAAKDKN